MALTRATRYSAAATAKTVPPAEIPHEDPPVTIVKAAPADPTAKTSLELSVHQRYVLHHVLYEAGVEYVFNQEQTEYMLKRRSDLGLPIFKRYIPREKRKVNHDGMPQMDMSSRDLPRGLVAAKASPYTDPKPAGPIEIGTADDLREAGIEFDSDEGVEV